MGSFGAGMASIGGSLAQAKELQRKQQMEQAKLAMEQGRFGLEKQRTGIEQERFDVEKQQANRPSYKGFSTIGGKMVALVQDPDGKLRVQSFDTIQEDSFSAAAMKAIEGIKDPALKQAAQDEAGMYLSQGDTKGAFGAVKSRIDKAQSDTEAENKVTRTEKFSQEQQDREFKEREKLKRMKGAGEGGEDDVSAYADDLMNRRITVSQIPAKVRGKVLDNIKKSGKMPPRSLNPTEQRLADNIKTIEPTLDSLESLIKSSDLANDNSPIAPRSAWLQYKYLKVAPEGVRGELIRNAAALQVMGASPWIQIGRGKYLFETISNHLPNPQDTPKLLLEKIKFLRGILKESKKAMGIEEENTDPLGVLGGR